ncbi:MAG TPA: family 43 glycosylhydrolase [Polyangiaceae bacterium]
MLSHSPWTFAWLLLATACSEKDGSADTSATAQGTQGTESVATVLGNSSATTMGATNTSATLSTGASSGAVGSTGAPSTDGGNPQGSGGAPSTSGSTTSAGGQSTGSDTSTATGATTTGGGGSSPSDCVPDGRAHNPLVTQIFTADPNAIVYGDKVYVYTSHDEDGQEGFDMIDYHVYSSDDMVNWQDHGVIIHANSLPWANNLYAPGACSKNGKYYLYIPNSGSAIGVAVADDPGGPFVDPLGEPLITPSFPNANVPWLFDPACFIDDDGQAYLYFGGGSDGGQNARVVRLKEDMVSLQDSMATTIPTTAFFEASFMHKHEGKYYFSYSSDFSTDHGAALEYLMSDSPMSGFQYVGKLLDNANVNRGNNNHGSIIEFGGKHYLFYHNRKLETELGVDKINNRSIAVQELSYAADGKIPTLTMSAEDYTISQLKCLDGFAEVEAERLAQEHGIEVEGLAGETVRVASIQNGDWVAYSQVDFRDGATSLVAQVASAGGGGTIDILIDGCIGGAQGTSIGSCEVVSTGGADTFAPLTCTLTETSGAHDLCLAFSGNPAFELDSFHLE